MYSRLHTMYRATVSKFEKDLPEEASLGGREWTNNYLRESGEPKSSTPCIGELEDPLPAGTFAILAG